MASQALSSKPLTEACSCVARTSLLLPTMLVNFYRIRRYKDWSCISIAVHVSAPLSTGEPAMVFNRIIKHMAFSSSVIHIVRIAALPLIGGDVSQCLMGGVFRSSWNRENHIQKHRGERKDLLIVGCSS